MNAMQEKVLEFHQKYGLPVFRTPRFFDIPTPLTRLLRSRLVVEEAAEYTAAMHDYNLLDIADALADLAYVVNGGAIAVGIDLEAVFNEVHRSNMTKTGHPSAGGKITKGPDYDPPRIVDVIEGY